jgi:DNA (cytosine-5)-methyltransferase 1
VNREQLEALQERLAEIEWLTDEPDAGAIISHFLRQPHECPPKLSRDNFKKLKNSTNQEIGAILGLLCDNGAQLLNRIVLDDVPFPPPVPPHFKFIDLFAGIGGFRIAFQDAGGECVFTSEWDKFAKKTYERNFGEIPFGDITKIKEGEIPDHDVLCAGFPCQPFSLAGVSKKNSLGRKHGFDDETQGTLFFDVKRIIKHHRPKAFMLENVKNLLSHDKGRTFEVIRKSLEDDLGYTITWKIVNGAKWVPQNRQRIFIVGFDPDQITVDKEDIEIPSGPPSDFDFVELNRIIQKKVEGHTLGPGTWDTLIRHKANHAEKGNGFGYGIHTVPIPDGATTRTISARYHKDGAEVLIEQPGERPRRLTVLEAMQLQGYDPEKFVFPVSNTQAYRQIGNSVVVPAVSACAEQIAKILKQSR